MKKILAAVFCAILAASCNFTKVDDAFLADDGISLTVKGEELCRFRENRWQVSSDLVSHRFTVFDDEMHDYYSLSLSANPKEIGQEIKGSIEWTSTYEIVSRNNLTFKVCKLDPSTDRIWLWNKKEQIAVVICSF